MKPDPSIGKKIRKIRLSRGKNQKEFADSLNISQGYYSNVENGKMDPSSALLKGLADIYDIDLNWLLAKEEKESRPSIKQSNISGGTVVAFSGPLSQSNVQIGDRFEKKINRIVHSLPEGSITPAQAVELKDYVNKIVAAGELAHYYPRPHWKGIWNAFYKKIRVLSYRELPEVFYPEAVRYFQKKLAIINSKGLHSRNKTSFIKNYIKNIHAIYKTQLNWTEEEYRAFLKKYYNVNSSLDLTDEQIIALYHKLNRIKTKKEE